MNLYVVFQDKSEVPAAVYLAKSDAMTLCRSYQGGVSVICFTCGAMPGSGVKVYEKYGT
jgi:hypothetical protein